MRTSDASLLTRALVAAGVLHGVEAALFLAGRNAVASALPASDRARLVLVTLAAGAMLALACGVVAWPLARQSPRLALALAAALPGAVIAVEALRHLADAPGPSLRRYALAAAAIAAGFALLSARIRPPSVRFAGRGALLATAACVVPGVVAARIEPHSPAESAAIARTEARAERSADPPPVPAAKNLLVLLVDTLRADHLGCYGYARDTSPRIDRLAAEGVLFLAAATPKPKTSPAVASLFTGLWPETHHIHATRTVLPAEHRTLAEILRDAGFSTFGVAANVNITPEFGYDQGFEEFVTIRRINEPVPVRKRAGRVRDRFVEWLDRREAEGEEGGRWFAYLHFVDPHGPYTPPQGFSGRFRGDSLDGRLGVASVDVGVDYYGEVIHESVYVAALGTDLDAYVAEYDAEIAYTDHVIGQILDEIDARGLRDETAVVFTADHGESMTEHATWFNHGEHPYEEQVHIPLVVRGPGLATGEVRTEPVSLVDLMPTLLDLVGVSHPDPMEGISFAPLLADGAGETAWDAPIFLSARTGTRHEVQGVRRGRYKYLRRPRGLDPREALRPTRLLLPGKRLPVTLGEFENQDLGEELYDLETDPREQVNLFWKLDDVRSDLARTLEEYRRRERPEMPRPVRVRPGELDPDLAEELRQMGYLGGGDDDH